MRAHAQALTPAQASLLAHERARAQERLARRVDAAISKLKEREQRYRERGGVLPIWVHRKRKGQA